MSTRLQEVVVDCADPAGLAAFWGQVLDARWAPVDEYWAVVDADPLLVAFQRVPEPKQSPKNRLHLDVRVPDADAAVARAVGLGARLTGVRELAPDGNGFVVLRDPEDNEFCFVVDEDGAWAAAMRAALDAAGTVPGHRAPP